MHEGRRKFSRCSALQVTQEKPVNSKFHSKGDLRTIGIDHIGTEDGRRATAPLWAEGMLVRDLLLLDLTSLHEVAQHGDGHARRLITRPLEQRADHAPKVLLHRTDRSGAQIVELLGGGTLLVLCQACDVSLRG